MLYEDAAVRNRFEKHLYDWSNIALAGGVVTILALLPIDYISSPTDFKWFVLYRVGAALSFVAIFFLNRLKVSIPYQSMMVLLAAVTSAVMIALMVAKLGGHESIYFTGFMIESVFVLGFVPLTLRYNLGAAAIIYFIYLVPILAYDTITNVVFFVDASALLFAGILSCVFVRYFTNRRLVSEFSLKSELDRKQEILEGYSRDLERAFDEEQSRRRELDALYKIARSIADSTPDMGENLAMIVRRAVTVTKSAFALVALAVDDGLVIPASFPVHVLGIGPVMRRRGDLRDYPFLKRVMAQRDPVLIFRRDHLEITPREQNELHMDKINTMLMVPLRSDERMLGVLVIGERRHRGRAPFSREKIALAKGIADQAVSAVLRAESDNRREESFLHTVLALANAVEARDSYTECHAEKMTNMTMAIGRRLGMDDAELNDLRFGSILHDIGKIGIPDAVLNKPGKLDEDEWKMIREHPGIGARIVEPVPYLAGASIIILNHHERYDGRGYPNGIAAEEIPLGARIVAVIDSFSAMTDRRVYKEPMSVAEALKELDRCAGGQFDPVIAALFTELVLAGEIDVDAPLLGKDGEGSGDRAAVA